MKCSNGWRRRSWLSFAGLSGLLLAGLLLAVTVLAQEAAPAQPTGLTADPAHDQVGLAWDDPDDSTITGYRILRRLPAQDPPGEFAVLLENTGSTLTTYVDSTVTPQTSYVYRVKAINAHGVSERSSWANALTPAVPAPPALTPVLTPAQPTGLTADPAHDQVGLDWDDPDDSTITGYRILRRLPAEDPPGEFAVLLEHTGSTLTTYLDTTVTSETSYVYRVKAINAQGSSERSSWANALTPAAPVLTPAPPTGLTADPAHDQVGLDWDDPDDSTITGYRILRRLPAEDLPGEFAVLLENTGSTLTSYVDSTVNAANELCLSSEGDQRARLERAILLGQRADPGRARLDARAADRLDHRPGARPGRAGLGRSRRPGDHRLPHPAPTAGPGPAGRVRRAARKHRFHPDHLRRYHRHVANELCLSSAGNQRAWLERAILLGQRADPGRPAANGPASRDDERRRVAGLG